MLLDATECFQMLSKVRRTIFDVGQKWKVFDIVGQRRMIWGKVRELGNIQQSMTIYRRHYRHLIGCRISATFGYQN